MVSVSASERDGIALGLCGWRDNEQGVDEAICRVITRLRSHVCLERQELLRLLPKRGNVPE